jgi:hypothetical protein
MHIDGHALALLLGIGVLSYLLGYLCGQMQFPDSPRDSELPQKETRRRQVKNCGAPGRYYRRLLQSILGRFQPCASQAFLYPRNQPAPKATIATAMVRVLSKGFDLRSFAENAVPSLIVPNPPNRARLREQDEANLRYFG